ncbi:phosphoglycolate phosphatase [Ottowia sp.]|uniref:phosphoglycolate phosphatase n=1 Tax=Ottowia sp. TaxID=1898956 RepID=UPI003A8AF2AA
MTAPAPTIQACMIDLDGTLLDTLGDFDAALNDALRQLGLPALTRAQIGLMVGKGSEHLVQSALAACTDNATPDIPLQAQTMALYQTAYARINGQFSRIYPGVEKGLQQLCAQGLSLACLTNKPLAHARKLLAAKGLDHYFAHTFGGDSFARKKPDPLPLIETCRALGSTPARAVMVGDSSNDAAAARAARCPVVLVRYGYNHGRPITEVNADAYIDSLAELPAWLAQRGYHQTMTSKDMT